jgi:uncharacterized protein (TIGR02001 family)
MPEVVFLTFTRKREEKSLPRVSIRILTDEFVLVLVNINYLGVEKMKSMKLNLTATAMAVSLATGTAMIAPQSAQAEVSATLGVANMYLWRGQNLTPNGAQAHGSLDYANGGFYAGVWATTETEGHETDLYAGYGGEIGGISFDLSYWKYLYPEDCSVNCDLGENDLSEVVASVGFGPVTVAGYFTVESGADSDKYYTIDASFGKFNILYGMWDLENPGNEYTHVTLSYSATDEITMAVSMASNDSGFEPETNGITENPLFYVGYTKSFDL